MSRVRYCGGMKKIGGLEIPETLDEEFGPEISRALKGAVRSGVPPEGLHVAARWWQLETHLRRLTYIESRAAFGPEWIDMLASRAIVRLDGARSQRYMPSPDDSDPVAFLDTFDLFDVITTWWEELFASDVGLDLAVWKGRVAELRPIRNRIAHCRRPHVNDADRIEQLLRDLEDGANRAYRSYVQFVDPGEHRSDPIVEDWVHRHRTDARRLIGHGADNKGIRFDLLYTVRPWASISDNQPLSETPGVFWVMAVSLDSDQRHLVVDDYWANRRVQDVLHLIGHAICPDANTLYVTFPAVGDPQAVSDAIGACFETVFRESRMGAPSRPYSARQRGLSGVQLDSRLDAGELLSVLTGLWPENRFSYFGASS